MKPGGLVVFDCDGTLADSEAVIVTVMQEAFKARDIAVPPAPAVRRIIGLSLEEGIRKLLPPGVGGASKIALAYREAWVAHHARGDQIEPLFDGVRETLNLLAGEGHTLAIATGKSRGGLLRLLEGHGILDAFISLQTADDAPGKPHPAMLHQAMAEAGFAPDETICVGDTVYDMQMAANAHVAAVGVSYGYHPAAELRAAGAKLVLDDIRELPAKLPWLLGGLV